MSRPVLVLGLAFGLLLPLLGGIAPAQNAQVNVLLVRADNAAGDSDGRLAKHLPTLKRLFRFHRYTQIGAGNAALPVPGKNKIQLVGGHVVEVSTLVGAPANMVRADIAWKKGGAQYIRTTMAIPKNKAGTVLGGPRDTDGSTLLLVLEAR